jgi:hypothetical protein
LPANRAGLRRRRDRADGLRVPTAREQHGQAEKCGATAHAQASVLSLSLSEQEICVVGADSVAVGVGHLDDDLDLHDVACADDLVERA